jgi:hypothetical protein
MSKAPYELLGRAFETTLLNILKIKVFEYASII